MKRTFSDISDSNEVIFIFTKVLTILRNNTLTTAEQIRTATTEQITIEFVEAMMKKGFDANFIADTFGLPLQKVEDIIQKIKRFSK